MSNMMLYKAVKHEVLEYYADHGFTIPQLFAVVTGKDGDVDMQVFWKNMVLDDYKHDMQEDNKGC